MSAITKTSTLLASLALFGVLGCENNELELGESLDLEEMEIVAAKGLDDLQSDLRKDGGSLADADVRPDSDTRPDSDVRPDAGGEDERLERLRREAIRFLRGLASQEECALMGILTGRYRGGGFKLAGHTWSQDLAGVAKGIYEDVEARRGGVFKARYMDIASGTGTLGGKYADPGVVHDIFGAFKGDWTPSSMDEPQGNIFGIWHPLYDRDDGVILGVWSNCNEPAAHRVEPVDVSDGDERD